MLHRPEAAHLGDLLRKFGTDRRDAPRRPRSAFHGPPRPAGRPGANGHAGRSSPRRPLRAATAFQGVRGSGRKDNSSRRPRRRRRVSLGHPVGPPERASFGPRPRPGAGICTGFPFARRGGAKQQTSPPLTGIVSGLRIDSLVADCRRHETLLHIGPPGSRRILCYYHQDLHRRRLQAGSRPDPSAPPPRPPTRRGPKWPKQVFEPSSATTAGYGHAASAPSIFRAGGFGR